MVYACDSCHFLFYRVSSPQRCPNCGKENLRPASPGEIQQFKQRRELDAWRE